MSDVALRAVSRDLTGISFCAGSGALDLALSLAVPRLRPVLYVEREAFAAATLVAAIKAGALADAPVWSDAGSAPGRQFRGCVDILFGGIPCQPYSLAGARQGADDERALWPAMRRLVVGARPWCVFLENVGGLASDTDIGRIHRELSRLGFAVEGGLFTAEEVGAPQERERLFILGVADPNRTRLPVGARQSGDPRQEQPPAQRDRRPVEDPDGLGGWHAAGQPVRARRRLLGASGQPMGDPYRGGHRGRAPEPVRRAQRRTLTAWSGQGAAWPPGPDDADEWASILIDRPYLEPVVCRTADGMADRLDRLRLLGNGVVPLAAAYAFRVLASRLAARSAGAAKLVWMMGDHQDDHRA